MCPTWLEGLCKQQGAGMSGGAPHSLSFSRVPVSGEVACSSQARVDYLCKPWGWGRKIAGSHPANRHSTKALTVPWLNWIEQVKNWLHGETDIIRGFYPFGLGSCPSATANYYRSASNLKEQINNSSPCK